MHKHTYIYTHIHTISRSSDRREFQATAPAWEKDRTKHWFEPWSKVQCRFSWPQSGLNCTADYRSDTVCHVRLPSYPMECMTEHNLNWIRYRIGNQCNCIRPGVTWSRTLSSTMGCTAAFLKRCRSRTLLPCRRAASLTVQSPNERQDHTRRLHHRLVQKL